MPKLANQLKSAFRAGARLAPMLLLLGLPAKTHAGDWGLTVAYNNPAGATLGGNLLFIGDVFGFEAGIGGLGGTRYDGHGEDGRDDSLAGGLWGDMDLKVLFGKTWRPYLEAGFGMALGAATGSGGGLSAGAGSPFVGGGLMYSGNPLLFYVAGDYKINSRDLFPVVGIGVKF